jgi:hypothetical protein
MGIINRDLDPTQQWDNFDGQYSIAGTSAVINLGQVPYQGQLLKVTSSAFGVSGSPILGIQIQRFIAGTGYTVISVNGSSLLTVTAFSTSGMQTHSLPAAGNSLVQLLSGDSVQIVTSVANTAASYTVNAVIQCLQDFKSQYGLGVGS